MKQIVLNIPDSKYAAFINHIRSKFSYIQIKENKVKYKESITKEDDDSEILLLSEKGLSEDWLSNEDNRWDEVL